jgi:hypothetical protein
MKSWRASVVGITLMVICAASAAAQVPAAPTKLQGLSIRTNRIFLVWQDNSNNETNFRIELSFGGGGFSEIGTTDANENVAFISGLNPGTAYSFRVRASNASGNSAYSNSVTVTTRTTNAPCAPSDTEMCLNNDRFRVQALYMTSGGLNGPAHAVKLTADSGYMWFFDATNIEVVVKVLNACSSNDRYWVFASGLTNVRVTLAVTDTLLGNTKVYVNPLNTPFPPIQDTNALASCP